MFVLTDFSGGLNLRDSNNSLAQNESPDMSNFFIRQRGSLKKRPGTQQVAAPTGTNALYLYTPNAGAPKMMASTPTAIYSDGALLDSTASAAPRSFATFGKGTQYNLIICSPEHRPLLYDGSTVRTMQSYDVKGQNPLPMPMISTATVHYDRLFCAGEPGAPSTIYFSEPGYVERYDSTSWIDIEPFDNEPILLLMPIWDSLLIFKRNGIWILYGSTRVDFALKKIATTKKVLPNFVRTIVNVDNTVIFRCTDGVFGFDGTTFTHLSEKIDPALKANQTSTSSACWYDGEYWLSNGTDTFVYNPTNKSWSRHSLAVSQFVDDSGTLKMLHPTGVLTRLDPFVATDQGVAYTAYYKTQYFDFGAPTNVKQFKEIKPDALSVGTGVSIEFDIDNGKAHGVFTLADTTANSPKWSQVNWGAFNWPNPPGAQSEPQPFPYGSYGDRMQLKFIAAGADLTEITGVIVDEEQKREVW